MNAKVTPEQAREELDRRSQIRQNVFMAMWPKMEQYSPVREVLKSVDTAVNYILSGKIVEGEAD